MRPHLAREQETCGMTTLYCDNGQHCPYGRVVETDDGDQRSMPCEAYSQSGSPRSQGLCLNCLDDLNRELELGD